MVPEQTPAELIWRDDDISSATQLEMLLEADAALSEYGLTHTVAVIAEGFDQRPDLVEAIKACRMDVQLHCWTHEDLTLNRESLHSLSHGVEMIERLFGARPTVLYPPWNRADETVVAVAAELGLRVSVEKVDQLINLVGELVITQAMLAQKSRELDSTVNQQMLAGLVDLDRNAEFRFARLQVLADLLAIDALHAIGAIEERAVFAEDQA